MCAAECVVVYEFNCVARTSYVCVCLYNYCWTVNQLDHDDDDDMVCTHGRAMYTKRSLMTIDQYRESSATNTINCIVLLRRRIIIIYVRGFQYTSMCLCVIISRGRTLRDVQSMVSDEGGGGRREL